MGAKVRPPLPWIDIMMNEGSFAPNPDGSALPSLSYEEMAAILPAYVLGALEPDEMLAVDSQLQHHKRLLGQLERLETISSRLALSAPEVQAPPQVKRQLMARVRAEAAVPVATSRPQASPQSLDPGPAAPVAKRQRWLDAFQERLGGPLPWPALAAAMAAVALLLLFYTGRLRQEMAVLAGQLASVQETLTNLRTQTEQLLASHTQLQQELQERENQLALFADANRVIALEGTEEAPGASGSFYAGEESSVLVLRGLAPLPPDRTYELWLMPSEGMPVPAGLVEVDDQGMATHIVPMADRPADFAAIGVSIEPAGGSPQPTGPIVLLGTSAS